ERKKNERKLQYLSHYDYLTGLRNRHGFEHDSQLLLKKYTTGIGIIVCDVDGLKLVNDTIGHDFGDKLLQDVAQIIKNSVREDDITARVGGDEFCIAVPLTKPGIVENIIYRLRQEIKEHNRMNPILPLSLSLGFAVSQDQRVDIEALFKEADDSMYRQKIHHNLSTRSIFMEKLMKMVDEKGYINSEQVKRIQQYVSLMAANIDLSERQLDGLLLLAKFHDIGKIGTPDHILTKPEQLSEKEKKEIERHCEIGYRIAQSIPGLSSIAELILKHHEWWNGGGYPLKLKGEEIPLECRIFSILMAYDAMTTGRPFRPALSHREAIAEIEKNAGVQFDPDLVPVFLQSVGMGRAGAEDAKMPMP
ncbi:MAG TPA: diguanylate cyclase, partial [Firmicutes bacterium]|nr:diguanylate cyclase [Bacillota bacterium]